MPRWARRTVLASLTLLAFAAYAEQPFRVYLSFEGQADTDLPPDYQVPG